MKRKLQQGLQTPIATFVIGLVLVLPLVLGINSVATAQKEEEAQEVASLLIEAFYSMSYSAQESICESWNTEPDTAALFIAREYLKESSQSPKAVAEGVVSGLYAVCGFSDALAQPLPFLSGTFNAGLDLSGYVDANF